VALYIWKFCHCTSVDSVKLNRRDLPQTWDSHHGLFYQPVLQTRRDLNHYINKLGLISIIPDTANPFVVDGILILLQCFGSLLSSRDILVDISSIRNFCTPCDSALSVTCDELICHVSPPSYCLLANGNQDCLTQCVDGDTGTTPRYFSWTPRGSFMKPFSDHSG